MTEKHDFNEIYAKYKNLVLKVAYKFSEDYDAAEDIMQSTFLKLYQELDEKEHRNIKAWLCATAKYSALNYKKRAERETSENELTEEESAVLDLATEESTEEEYFEGLAEKERMALHEHIMMGLMEKNPRWHEAVLLVYVREYSQAEAAEKLQMGTDALYVMLHRARNWIKKTYGVEYEEMNRQ